LIVKEIYLHTSGGQKRCYLASTIRNFRIAVSFRETNGLGSAVFTLRWFKFAHIDIEVNILHKDDGHDSINKSGVGVENFGKAELESGSDIFPTTPQPCFIHC